MFMGNKIMISLISGIHNSENMGKLMLCIPSECVRDRKREKPPRSVFSLSVYPG